MLESIQSKAMEQLFESASKTKINLTLMELEALRSSRRGIYTLAQKEGRSLEELRLLQASIAHVDEEIRRLAAPVSPKPLGRKRDKEVKNTKNEADDSKRKK